MPLKWGSERSNEVRAFLEVIVALEYATGLYLGHEDGHGAFIVERARPGEDRARELVEWMLDANEETA